MRFTSFINVKALVLSSLLLLTFPILAQSLPKEASDIDFKNWRILMQVVGPSNWTASLNAVKPLNTNWTFRFGISPLFSFDRSKSDNSSPAYYSNFKAMNKSRSFGVQFSLGTEYHLLQESKLDPYIFFGTGFSTSMQKSNREISYELIEADLSGLVAMSSTITANAAPRFSFNPFFGFGANYFFHPRLAIGVEYSLGPGFTLIKGNSKQREVIQEIFENGDVRNETIEDKQNSNAFSLELTQHVGLHFVYIVKNKKEN